MQRQGRNNKKVTIAGITFDSKMEANYYLYLRSRKDIEIVELQPQYTLQDGFEKYGRKIKPITYKADFLIRLPDNSLCVIDVKGFMEEDFKLKRKMFDSRYSDLPLMLVSQCPAKYREHAVDGWIDSDLLHKLRAAERRKVNGR